jgi:hypothetical protein
MKCRVGSRHPACDGYFSPVMQPAPLTIAQQRDYVRRLAEGWKAASDGQIAAARARTDEEKWTFADCLLSDRPQLRKGPSEISGLVEQQRLFMKLRRG